MTKFIVPEDYGASVHPEILDALVRSDERITFVCEERAIAQMRGYLSARYDCDQIFAARGSDRHPLVLMMALDIALYHIFSIHNPRNMSQLRIDRYRSALEWLRDVGRGDLSIDGVPQTVPQTGPQTGPQTE